MSKTEEKLFKEILDWLTENIDPVVSHSFYTRFYNKFFPSPSEHSAEEILQVFISEVKREFSDQNWEYLDFIKDRVLNEYKSISQSRDGETLKQEVIKLTELCQKIRHHASARATSDDVVDTITDELEDAGFPYVPED